MWSSPRTVGWLVCSLPAIAFGSELPPGKTWLFSSAKVEYSHGPSSHRAWSLPAGSMIGQGVSESSSRIRS